MPFLSGCHTHSTHCDGKHTLREMLTAARDLRFVSYGFSSHAAQGFDNSYSMSLEQQENYLKEARALQREFHAPRVWVGLELDSQSHEREVRHAFENTDYVLGSTHYLRLDGEKFAAVDGPAELLKQWVDSHFAGDGLAMAREYFEIEAAFVQDVTPHVIGHFDLVRKHAAALGLFEENDPAYRKLALNALERCYNGQSVLEVNTGGMARGYLDTPYPTLELLCAWREMGGEITLTSDCHDKTMLTYAYPQALALIREAGYDHLLRLGTGDELWERCEPY